MSLFRKVYLLCHKIHYYSHIFKVHTFANKIKFSKNPLDFYIVSSKNYYRLSNHYASKYKAFKFLFYPLLLSKKLDKAYEKCGALRPWWKEHFSIGGDLICYLLTAADIFTTKISFLNDFDDFTIDKDGVPVCKEYRRMNHNGSEPSKTELNFAVLMQAENTVALNARKTENSRHRSTKMKYCPSFNLDTWDLLYESTLQKFIL